MMFIIPKYLGVSFLQTRTFYTTSVQPSLSEELRKFTCLNDYHLSLRHESHLANCPNNVRSAKGSSWETPVAFSFLLSPISFNLGPSLSPLATVAQPWSFWRAQTSYFVFVPRWNISTNDTHWQFKNGWFCFSSISFRLDIPEQEEHRMATVWLSQVQQGSRGSLD